MKLYKNYNPLVSKKEIPIYIVVSIMLLFLLLISLLFAVTIGPVDISIKDVYSVILYEIFNFEDLSQYADGSVHDVVWLIRLPRIILAISVGAGLSVCGIVLQAIVKNPLAEQYTLGISSGATLGATIAIFFGVGAAFGSSYVGVMSFVGAFSVSLLVVLVSNVGTPSNTVKLLLSGMAIGYVCIAFSSFFVFYGNDPNATQTLTFWTMGSLAGAKWSTNIVTSLIVFLGIIFFMTQYRILNMMLLGDETSVTLGTNLHKYRIIYLLINSLMIGFIVASSGTIGFVGLIIPHFARMFFGTNHRKIIPVSALIGAIFLIWADVLSRIIMPETEIPIGILISMIGAPCFVFLLMKKTYSFGGGN